MTETIGIHVHGAEEWIPYLAEGAAIPALSIVMGGLLLILLVSGLLLLGFVRVLRDGGSTRRLRILDARERETFRDLQRGFKRMEERIDSLELLLAGPSGEVRARRSDYE